MKHLYCRRQSIYEHVHHLLKWCTDLKEIPNSADTLKEPKKFFRLWPMWFSQRYVKFVIFVCTIDNVDFDIDLIYLGDVCKIISRLPIDMKVFPKVKFHVADKHSCFSSSYQFNQNIQWISPTNWIFPFSYLCARPHNRHETW